MLTLVFDNKESDKQWILFAHDFLMYKNLILLATDSTCVVRNDWESIGIILFPWRMFYSGLKTQWYEYNRVELLSNRIYKELPHGNEVIRALSNQRTLVRCRQYILHDFQSYRDSYFHVLNHRWNLDWDECFSYLTSGLVGCECRFVLWWNSYFFLCLKAENVFRQVINSW